MALSRFTRDVGRGSFTRNIRIAFGCNTSFTDQAGLTSSYQYDLVGNRTSTTYPSGVTVQPSSEAIEAFNSGDASLMQAESAQFAANASGDVSVYANAAANDANYGNTFWNHELPQLLNNPNVTSINYIFPK